MNEFKLIVLTYAILNTNKYYGSDVYNYFIKKFNEHVKDMEQVDVTFQKLFNINKTYQNLNILKIILSTFIFPLSILIFLFYAAIVYPGTTKQKQKKHIHKHILLAIFIFEILFVAGIMFLNKIVDERFEKFITDYLQINKKKNIKPFNITLKEYIASLDDLTKCKNYLDNTFQNYRTNKKNM